MIPVARIENLLIQEVDNELIVYDQERDTCHCLNPVAARVWHYCDGRNTVEDIAKFLKEELEISADEDIRGLVWLALEELESLHLMKQYLREPIVSTPTISRRKVIKRATLVGGFALGTLFPMVRSITSPALADMASGVNLNKVATSNVNPNAKSNPGLGAGSGSGSGSGPGAGSVPDVGSGSGSGPKGGLPPGVPPNEDCEFENNIVPSYRKCGKGNCSGTCKEIRDNNGILQDCKCVKKEKKNK